MLSRLFNNQSYIAVNENSNFAWIDCCEFLKESGVDKFRVAFSPTGLEDFWLEQWRDFGFKFNLSNAEAYNSNLHAFIIEKLKKGFVLARGNDRANRYALTTKNTIVLYLTSYLGVPGNIKVPTTTQVSVLITADGFISKPENFYQVNKDAFDILSKEETQEVLQRLKLGVSSDLISYEIEHSKGISRLAHHTIIRYLWNKPHIVKLIKELTKQFGFSDAVYLAHSVDASFLPSKGLIVNYRTYSESPPFSEGMKSLAKGFPRKIYEAIPGQVYLTFYSPYANNIRELYKIVKEYQEQELSAEESLDFTPWDKWLTEIRKTNLI